jgi:plasmid stabilization system protein ParE
LSHHYVVTPAADRDTDGHFRYISQHNYEAAVRFLYATEATYERLAATPELGERQTFRRTEMTDLRA